MAKPRKQKNEEQKVDNSEAVVRHQKLCLSIELEKRRIYGFTELEVVVPENGIVGLHADNLIIERVTVDGEPADFEVFPHYQHLDTDNRWCSVSTANSAADAAGSVYLSCLERELVPNLLIMCTKSIKLVTEQQEQTPIENGTQSSSEAKQNVRVVHIDYWVEKAETGIHIDDNVLHTDNQIRRARCWFPCMDDSSQRCSFDLEFTVANNLVVASTGTLLYQVLSKDDPPRKTFVYKLCVPVAARWVSLAVAPFEIFPDRHNGLISHICLPANLAKLQNTVGFLHSAYSHYEHYLSTKFPFGSYTQVFIDPEMAISSLSLGASMNIFSSQILYDEKIIDQTIDTRIKLAYGLARQWFGVYITAETPNDEWLLDGLAGFLTDSFIKQFLGNNEARYRRYKAGTTDEVVTALGIFCLDQLDTHIVQNTIDGKNLRKRADDGAATALSSSGASKDLYGTQSIGFYGKIRSWKSVAVLQMLEKQMGPESFCKILKNIVAPPKAIVHPLRTLSTKEFRHLANEVGNLERPFLREFFPRWVASSGCPVLKMGFSYNKRKNMVELAVLRGCTATPDSVAVNANGNPDSVKRESDVGWPGMMSIRVHELDGMYDHPVLPMAGETWQLLEIQCHSKLAAKRFQKPKKGPKHDGSDDNVDMAPPVDMRSNVDSPLLWLRADPETEYLAEIHFNQPVQMWINQLEKDRDVVAQTQAITALEYFPRLLSVVNALSSILGDSQAFWRVRVEAAFALASTASEETDWAGLLHLIKFYKSRRFDTKIGLPKPNDFHDFAEYFVLEAIPHAIALVRASDMKSPREAIEFILQLLKYNENTGNPYSDVFWLSALVQAIGELEFGQQTVPLLSSLLKRIDRLLQFDRLMPSYNGILTISCIRVLTQIALKLSEFFPLDRVMDLIKPFCSPKTKWQVRIEAARALLDLEFHGKGIDAALILFIRYLEEEVSLRGQVKLAVHAMRLCQIRDGSEADSDVASETLVALLRLLESPVAFNNVVLRHYLFCILQVLAGRPPTLCGVPRDEILQMGHAETCSELKNIFAALVKQSKPLDHSLENLMLPYDGSLIPGTNREHDAVSNGNEGSHPVSYIPEVVVLSESPAEENYNGREESQQHTTQPNFTVSEAPREADAFSNSHEQKITEVPMDVDIVSNSHEVIEPEVPKEGDFVDHDQKKPEEAPRELDYVDHERKKPDHSVRRADTASNSNECRRPEEASRGADTISNSQGRKKPVLKIRVKQSSASSRAEDATVERSQGPQNGPDRAASSSVSIEAPQRNFTETVSINNQNQNLEDVNSCHDVGSRVTASIGSVKLTGDTEELLKELQCTADSSKVLSALPPADQSNNADLVSRKFISLNSLAQKDQDSGSLAGKREKEKKKDKRKDKEKKHKKRDRDDPEYLEKKRLKKERKLKEKEREKLQSSVAVASSIDLKRQKVDSESKMSVIREEAKVSPMVLDAKRDDTIPVTRVTSVQIRLGEPGGGQKDVVRKVDMSGYNISDDSKKTDANTNASEGTSSRKFKIKIKNRTLNKP